MPLVSLMEHRADFDLDWTALKQTSYAAGGFEGGSEGWPEPAKQCGVLLASRTLQSKHWALV
jgi:hypothetical protein